MPHILADIEEAIDNLRGNATDGALSDLRSNAVAADNYVQSHQINQDEKAESLHDILNNIMAALVDGDYSNVSGGVSAAVDGWNTDITDLL